MVSLLTLMTGAAVAVGQQTPGQPTNPAPGQTQPGQTQPGTQPGRTPGVRDSQQPGLPSQPAQPGLTTRGQKVEPTQVSQVTFDWPAGHKEAIRDLLQKYGQPDEATPSHVIWKDAGPFKKVVVFKEEAQHLFPQPHTDFVESCVMMRVPSEKIDDLARFDGSIMVNRTRGTIAAICDKEENNILALNLAHDIITDKKSVEEARQYMAKAVAQAKSGTKDPLAGDLQFRPDLAAADPDQPARMLGSPEFPDRGLPGRDLDKDRDKDKDKELNPGKSPGEVPKSNPEVPRR
jgi:hypothetical protein